MTPDEARGRMSAFNAFMELLAALAEDPACSHAEYLLLVTQVRLVRQLAKADFEATLLLIPTDQREYVLAEYARSKANR